MESRKTGARSGAGGATSTCLALVGRRGGAGKRTFRRSMRGVTQTPDQSDLALLRGWRRPGVHSCVADLATAAASRCRTCTRARNANPRRRAKDKRIRREAHGIRVALGLRMSHHPTISFEKPSLDDRFRVLPYGASADDVVSLARCAGLAFLSGSAFGWSREQVRQWLILDYGAATAWTRMDHGHSPVDPTLGLDDLQVDMLVDRSRRRVLRMLERSRDMWATPTFTRDMIDGRLVVCVYDRNGTQAYAPASSTDMGLVHRVTSLFVADYLSRPSDYDRIVSCSACGEVSIGSLDTHPSWCTEPPRQSGIVEREGASVSKRQTTRGCG